MGIEPVKGDAVILLGHLLQSGENIVKSVVSMSMSSLHTSTSVEQAPWSEAICNTLSWLPGISSTDGSLGKSPKVKEDKPISKPSISSSENLKHCLLEDEWGPVQPAATKWLAHLLGTGAISAVAKLGRSRVTSDRTAFMNGSPRCWIQAWPPSLLSWPLYKSVRHEWVGWPGNKRRQMWSLSRGCTDLCTHILVTNFQSRSILRQHI